MLTTTTPTTTTATTTTAQGVPASPGDPDGGLGAAILASSILVVDDQAAHVHLLERLLHDSGYLNVSSTLDPRQVGALHREHPRDLILLDLQMPGLDGFGVMDELRAAAGSNCLPVIVLTAQPGHKLRALQAGARDFISKPFEVVEVQVRIHHMLEVRLLQTRLEAHNRHLERLVQERTAALQDSEARYRSMTELAVDWFWEQNEAGAFTAVSGPVLELLGIADGEHGIHTWNPAERRLLTDNIQARRPFLDLVMHRSRADGSQQQFRISGEPMFDSHCRFTGYRGLGVEVQPAR